MGVLDIWRAGLGTPRGLTDALAAHKFALAVLDNKIDGTWALWPGLLESYRLAETIDGPRVVSGAPTEPRYVMVPKPPPPVIDRELQ
jgi:hypothetical protein